MEPWFVLFYQSRTPAPTAQWAMKLIRGALGLLAYAGAKQCMISTSIWKVRETVNSHSFMNFSILPLIPPIVSHLNLGVRWRNDV